MIASPSFLSPHHLLSSVSIHHSPSWQYVTVANRYPLRSPLLHSPCSCSPQIQILILMTAKLPERHGSILSAQYIWNYVVMCSKQTLEIPGISAYFLSNPDPGFVKITLFGSRLSVNKEISRSEHKDSDPSIQNPSKIKFQIKLEYFFNCLLLKVKFSLQCEDRSPLPQFKSFCHYPWPLATMVTW